MIKIRFPKRERQHYYRYHYTFLLNVFKEAKAEIELCSSTELDTVRFTINIDNKDLLIDVSDSMVLYPKNKDYKYCFKYHCSEEIHKNCDNIYPLGAMSFYDWEEYYKLLPKIKYTCNNDTILNNQRVYANATKRRSEVQKRLKRRYEQDVDFKLTNQETYWNKINNCLVSVHVPGYRNDILDRGQFQMMAFGCCTISPKLLTILSYNQKLIPGQHYIECKADYSDLIDKIEWCKSNRKECIKIGKQAQELFSQYCTPEKITEWVSQCLQK